MPFGNLFRFYTSLCLFVFAAHCIHIFPFFLLFLPFLYYVNKCLRLYIYRNSLSVQQWQTSQRNKCFQNTFSVIPESTAVPLWAQEKSGFPVVLSSHRWILLQLPCILHSTGSSSLHSENTCWGCHFVVPRNSQLQPPPRSGCPRLPLGSVQCLHSLKYITHEPGETEMKGILMYNEQIVKKTEETVEAIKKKGEKNCLYEL